MLVADIAECPRCGEVHADLPYTKLLRPSAHFTHWCTCPNTDEPMLLYFGEPPKDMENYKVLSTWANQIYRYYFG